MAAAGLVPGVSEATGRADGYTRKCFVFCFVFCVVFALATLEKFQSLDFVHSPEQDAHLRKCPALLKRRRAANTLSALPSLVPLQHAAATSIEQPPRFDNQRNNHICL